jgi:hypothetical protein
MLCLLFDFTFGIASTEDDKRISEQTSTRLTYATLLRTLLPQQPRT